MFDFTRIIPAFISRRRYLHMHYLNGSLKALLEEKDKHLKNVGSELNAAYDKIEKTAARYEELKAELIDVRAKKWEDAQRCKKLEDEMEKVLERYEAMVAKMEADKKQIRALERELDSLKDSIAKHIRLVQRQHREARHSGRSRR